MRPLLIAFVVAVASVGHAQLGDILGGGGPRIPGLSDIFKKGPAITTSLKDAKWEDPTKDDFNPTTKNLFDLKRSESGTLILQEGAWAAAVQSYCLHAGTHGPGGGDGYLYAPPKGPYEKMVMNIGKNSVLKPNIPQREVQLLLWAVVARTKFSDMNNSMQRVAMELLTQKQIVDLNGGALGILTDDRLAGGIVKEPPLVRQVLEAENRLRRMFSVPNATFEQFEAIAVLTGDAPWGKDSRQVPATRWSKHPAGYWVRYRPSGYSKTLFEIFVEPNSKAIGTELDPSTQIATPGNTARQRLLQTARAYGAN